MTSNNSGSRKRDFRLLVSFEIRVSANVHTINLKCVTIGVRLSERMGLARGKVCLFGFDSTPPRTPPARHVSFSSIMTCSRGHFEKPSSDGILFWLGLAFKPFSVSLEERM